jgi:hypothetical protein
MTLPSPRPHALLGEAESGAMPRQAAKAVSTSRTLGLSPARHSATVFGRSPQGPVVGLEMKGLKT